MSNSIEYKVELGPGDHANIVADATVVQEMYPAGVTDERPIVIGESTYDPTVDVTLTPVNSMLRFRDLPDGRRAIYGNTVTRGCAVAADCGSCALAGAGLSVEAMSAQNCARANTARTFELAEQDPRGRFVLLPTSRNAYVVGDEKLTREYNGDELMQNRLAAANSVVITRSWLQENGLESFTVGMNGADGSMGVAITRVDDEQLFIPFCSMRGNMGDRAEQDQILRQALNAYFDSQEFDDEKRAEVLAEMEVSIALAASASLRYFAHHIQVPEEGTKQYDEVVARHPDLVSLAGGRLTSAIVLDDQYPGALGRGSIYPQLEAEMGIRSTPITPGNCPGDGQSCHVDYRTETEYALRKQLTDMGISAENITYDDSYALDPAAPDNNAASNRREQNNGVPVPQTSRTLNAMRVVLGEAPDKATGQVEEKTLTAAELDLEIAGIEGRLGGMEWVKANLHYETQENRDALASDYQTAQRELVRLQGLRTELERAVVA